MNPSSKEYCSARGIDVQFNTLGSTPELVKAYISSTADLVRASEQCASEYVKGTGYNRFYPISERTKYTGFEALRKNYIQFKIKQTAVVKVPQITPASVVDSMPDNSIDYKLALRDELLSIDKPILLYLSGGIDSELVALSLIDSNKAFTPVIFHWTNNDGAEINTEELSYAHTFCDSHSIVPIIKTINAEALWESLEFEQMSIDAGIVSPHLVTHLYMTTVMHQEFPNYKHLFGGEVRYRNNYTKDDGSLANIVLTTKVTPGYNAQFYVASGTGGGQLSLNLYNTGAWVVTFLTGSGSGAPTSGTFAVAPLNSTGYEYRIASMNVLEEGDPTSSVPASPASCPTAWAPIGANTAACSVTALGGFSSTSSRECDFYIEIRSADGSGTNYSTINMTANNS
jgi:hypothetical protein